MSEHSTPEPPMQLLSYSQSTLLVAIAGLRLKEERAVLKHVVYHSFIVREAAIVSCSLCRTSVCDSKTHAYECVSATSHLQTQNSLRLIRFCFVTCVIHRTYVVYASLENTVVPDNCKRRMSSEG